MIIEQSRVFAKKAKKLNAHQKKYLDNAVKHIAKNPKSGQEKKGKLTGVRVYKYKEKSQLIRLAYMHPHSEKIILLAFCAHENFDRDLENNSF